VSDALAYLRGRQRAGRWRYLRRRLQTPRGLLSTAGTVFLVVVVLGAQVVRLWRHAEPLPASWITQFYAPALAAIALAGVLAARGLALTAAEVELLFPAPLSRRDLMRHYLLSRLRVQAAASLWVAVYTGPIAPHWASALAAVMLWFCFSFLLATGAVVVRAWADGHVSPGARQLVRWLVWAGLIAAALSIVGAARGAPELTEGLRAAVTSPAARALGLVALPFAHLFAARGVGEALGWGGVCVALLGVAAAALLRADVDLRERSVAASARLEKRRARLLGRRPPVGEDEPVVRRRPARSLRLPELAFLGTAAPIARRHLAELRRDRGRMAAAVGGSLFYNALLVAAPAVVAVKSAQAGQRVEGWAAGLLATVLLVPVLSTGHVALDFRRDLDRMAALRALPVSPMRLTVGQLFGPAALLCAMQLLALAAVAVALRPLPALAVAAAALTLLPLVWTVVAIDNAVFLVLPYRLRTAGTPGGMAVAARGYLVAIVKLFCVGLCVVATGAAALLAWKVSGASLVAAGVSGIVVMLGAAATFTWLAARAFSGFDVSRDVPA
jgi:hypothetical protein